MDQPVVGRFDGENYNIGFNDIVYQTYPELEKAAEIPPQNLFRGCWQKKSLVQESENHTGYCFLVSGRSLLEACFFKRFDQPGGERNQEIHEVISVQRFFLLFSGFDLAVCFRELIERVCV